MKKNNTLQSIFFMLGFAVLSTPVIAENTSCAPPELMPYTYTYDTKALEEDTEGMEKAVAVSYKTEQKCYLKNFQMQWIAAKIAWRKAEKTTRKTELESYCKKKQQAEVFVLEYQNK